MGVLSKITRNCNHATLLIEKKLITTLSLRERIFLRIHLIGCDACRLYQAQTTKIGQMIKNLFNESPGVNITLDDEVKKEMQERIEEKLNKN